MNKRGFGGIYLRGNTWWIRYSHQGQEYRESAGTDNQATARKLLKQRIQEMGRPGRFIGPAQERVTFADLADMVRTNYAVNRFRSAPSSPAASPTSVTTSRTPAPSISPPTVFGPTSPSASRLARRRNAVPRVARCRTDRPNRPLAIGKLQE